MKNRLKNGRFSMVAMNGAFTVDRHAGSQTPPGKKSQTGIEISCQFAVPSQAGPEVRHDAQGGSALGGGHLAEKRIDLARQRLRNVAGLTEIAPRVQLGGGRDAAIAIDEERVRRGRRYENGGENDHQQ
jgi:hypothetical protein